MFYRGDIVRFQEIPKPKLNWFKKIFYKEDKKSYVSYYVRKIKTPSNLLEYRILLKNNDFFKVEYRNIKFLLLIKLNVGNLDYCELEEFDYIVDPYLQYNGNFENFVIASKEDIKRVERKQKLDRINENR